MTSLGNDKLLELEEMAYEIRRLSTEMIAEAKWGHIGGSYSLAEILAVLYGSCAKLYPEDPDFEGRDYIILSKAHTAPALYSALAVSGFFPRERLNTYCSLDGLGGHLEVGVPGVEMSGGSLGLGLSYSVGLALALKMQERFSQKVYCITGDGELNEGQIWEAAMSASHFGLDNLILVIDYNKVMAKGFVKEQMAIAPLKDKFGAFGFKVMEIDGHNIPELNNAFMRAKYSDSGEKPICIIANTVKGMGVAQCEFNYKWHTHAPSVKKANEFLKELADRYSREYREFCPKERKDIETLEDLIGGGAI